MLTRSGHPSARALSSPACVGHPVDGPFSWRLLDRHTKADTELLDRAATAREARPQKGRT